MSNTSGTQFVITGRHVLFAMLGFFGIIIAVNAVMINLAISTHTGVVANEPYRKGLKYNERIAAAERQAELGWRDEIRLAPQGDKLSIDIRDKDGKPVQGLAITAIIAHPVSQTDEVTVALTESAAGLYEAALPHRDAGTYVASIEATDPARSDEGILYRAKERLWLKP